VRASLATLGLLGAVTAAIATPAHAAGAETLTLDCRIRAYTAVLWPTGHPAMPNAGMSAYPSPNAAIYRRGRPLSDARLLALVDSDGKSQSAGKCKPVRAQRARGKLRSKRVLRTTGTVGCRFNRGVRFAIRSGARGDLTLTVLLGSGRPVFVAQPRESGSRILYDRRFCHAGSAPS
jgi:hypothetical protein